MSGIACALISAGSTEVSGIIAGNSAGIIGFNRGSIGSIIPADATLKGRPVVVIEDQNIAGAFIVILEGVVASNFFTSITINGVTRLTSAASFSASTNSQWDWNGATVGLLDGNLYPVSFS